jgi:hypothetical protein
LSVLQRFSADGRELEEDVSGIFPGAHEGQARKDANVAEAMYKNATGYDYYEEQAVKLRETSYVDGRVSKVREYVDVVTVKRHQPADTTAQIFWSKNRRPDLWRDVKKIDSEPEMIQQTYRGEAVLARLIERGFVQLEGETHSWNRTTKLNRCQNPEYLKLRLKNPFPTCDSGAFPLLLCHRHRVHSGQS